MLDTELQPVTKLCEGTAAGPGGAFWGERGHPALPSRPELATDPQCLGRQDKVSTPSVGGTPDPRNKGLSLLHKLGHGSERGRGEARGHPASLFLTLSWASVFGGTIVQENILLGRLRQDSKSLEPQTWGEGFEKEEGALPNPPKGPGHFPCRCPCTAGLKAVWVGEGPDGGP